MDTIKFLNAMATQLENLARDMDLRATEWADAESASAMALACRQEASSLVRASTFHGYN